MVSRKLLRKVLEQNSLKWKDLAKLLNVKPSTLEGKLNSGCFRSKEIEIMLHSLDFKDYNPFCVFFDTLENSEIDELFNGCVTVNPVKNNGLD